LCISLVINTLHINSYYIDLCIVDFRTAQNLNNSYEKYVNGAVCKC
jgi:hypothetical protein